MVTVDAVKSYLKQMGTTADDALITDVVAAVNGWVAGLQYVIDHTDPDTGDWPPDVDQGALMYAARLCRRRNTPGGVEAFQDAVVYVRRTDPDVAILLHLGRPGVG